MKKKRQYKPNQNHIHVLSLLPEIGKGKGKLNGFRTVKILADLNNERTAQQSLADVSLALRIGEKSLKKKQLAQLRSWLKVLEKHGFVAHNSKHQWHLLKIGSDFLLSRERLLKCLASLKMPH